MALDIRRATLRFTWEENDELVVSLNPLQGHWTADQYLLLTNQTNRLLEYTDGYIEVLPMPTDHHQAIVEWLFLALKACIEQLGGKVRFAPLRLQVREGSYREPDILLMRDAQDPRRQNQFWLGADLVAEVVSDDNPERDTKIKRTEYAEAGIPEYWIVNPREQSITVLALDGTTYSEHGIFGRGEQAHSTLLNGFSVNVNEVLDAE